MSPCQQDGSSAGSAPSPSTRRVRQQPLRAAICPARRAGNNKQTAEETGNDFGKRGAVFSDEAVKCLRPGPSSPPRAARGTPAPPPLRRTGSKSLSTLNAAADFGCFAGHNASLASAAGCWDFLGSQRAPQSQGMFANVTMRLALRRHPLPQALHPGTSPAPGLSQGLPQPFGQHECFWGDNMRTRGFSRNRKHP